LSQSEREPSLREILEAFKRGPCKGKEKQEPSEEAVLSGPEHSLREILEAFERGPTLKEKDKQLPSKEAVSETGSCGPDLDTARESLNILRRLAEKGAAT